MLVLKCDRCGESVPATQGLINGGLVTLPTDWTRLHIQEYWDEKKPPSSQLKRELCKNCTLQFNTFMSTPALPPT